MKEILVQIGKDEKVTMEEYEMAINLLAQKKGSITKNDKIEILNELVKNKLLLLEAKRRNFKIDKDLLNAQYENFVKQSGGEKELQKIMDKYNVKKEMFLDGIKNDILIEMLVETESKDKVTVSEDEIKEFYSKNAIKSPHKIGIAHIFLPVKSDIEDSVAKRKIYDIYETLKKKKGKNFVKLVKKYSECPTKERDGIIGYVTQNNIERTIWSAIVNLKVGEFTMPIRSSEGYHIIRVLNIEDERDATYEEAEKDIKLALMSMKIKKYITEFTKKLEKEIKVIRNEKLINKVINN